MILNRAPHGRLAAVVLVLLALPALAEWDPPRVSKVIRPAARVDPLHDTGPPYYCAIDRGTELKIEKGDLMNIYRQRRIITRPNQPVQILMGSLIITSSYSGSSVGIFTPSAEVRTNPLLRFRNIMTGDVAIPSLVLDSDVLFESGQAQLKPSAQREVQKVADFIRYHQPPTLVIEGHTDSDGDVALNQQLSEGRANALRTMLLDNYDFIDPSVLQARGEGEDRPIAPNDTPENKARNRRIEVIVIWEILEERAVSLQEEEAAVQ